MTDSRNQSQMMYYGILGVGMLALAGAICYAAVSSSMPKTIVVRAPAVSRKVRFGNLHHVATPAATAPQSAVMPTLTPYRARYL